MLPEEDRAKATGIGINNFVEIDAAVPEICSWTDRHTHRHTDRQIDCNTLLPYHQSARMSKIKIDGLDQYHKFKALTESVVKGLTGLHVRSACYKVCQDPQIIFKIFRLRKFTDTQTEPST